jgi:hypothetical protein
VLTVLCDDGVSLLNRQAKPVTVALRPAPGRWDADIPGRPDRATRPAVAIRWVER